MGERLLLDHVDGDDLELGGRPLLGAGEHAAQLDRIEQRRPGAAAAQLEDAQLAPAVRQLDREADVADEIDAERLECGPPAEVDAAPGPLAELVEVAPHRRRGRARAARVRAPLGSTNASRRTTSASTCASRASASSRFDDREAGIGRPVRVPLAARVLAGEAPPAHLVGAPEHRRRDPRPLLDLHDPTVTPS